MKREKKNYSDSVQVISVGTMMKATLVYFFYSFEGYVEGSLEWIFETSEVFYNKYKTRRLNRACVSVSGICTPSDSQHLSRTRRGHVSIPLRWMVCDLKLFSGSNCATDVERGKSVPMKDHYFLSSLQTTQSNCFTLLQFQVT